MVGSWWDQVVGSSLHDGAAPRTAAVGSWIPAAAAASHAVLGGDSAGRSCANDSEAPEAAQHMPS